jgi:putative transposase
MDPDTVIVSRGLHRPLHAYGNEAIYWITAATLNHAPLLRGEERLRYFVDELVAAAERWNVELIAWTVMEHHYHAILSLKQGADLPRFLGRLHGRTAIHVNRLDQQPGRQVWRQYWDVFLQTEGDLWSRVNYIWRNPVRHGFCSVPEEWPWTNLHALMSDLDDVGRAKLEAFPAPRNLSGDW